jgi:hypothetical protein
MQYTYVKGWISFVLSFVIAFVFAGQSVFAAGETITGGVVTVTGSSGTVGSSTSITTQSHEPITVIHTALTLTSGWNVFSTPKLLSGIGFSNGGTGLSFYQLEGGTWTGTTIAANTTNVKPLEGFLINNTTSSSVTMNLSYTTGTLSAGQKIFTKSVTAGWNILGVADTSLLQNQTDFTEVAVLTQLNSLSGDYSNAIDWTDATFDGGDNSLAIDQLKQITSSDVTDTTEKFEEFKSYAIFIKQGGGSYAGSQP